MVLCVNTSWAAYMSIFSRTGYYRFSGVANVPTLRRSLQGGACLDGFWNPADGDLKWYPSGDIVVCGSSSTSENRPMIQKIDTERGLLRRPSSTCTPSLRHQSHCKEGFSYVCEIHRQNRCSKNIHKNSGAASARHRNLQEALHEDSARFHGPSRGTSQVSCGSKWYRMGVTRLSPLFVGMGSVFSHADMFSLCPRLKRLHAQPRHDVWPHGGDTPDLLLWRQWKQGRGCGPT